MAKARKFGKAEVEVSIRDRVGVGLKAIEQKMRGFASGLNTIGTRIATVGGGIAAAGAAIAGLGAGVMGGLMTLASRFADLGGNLDDIAQRTGIAASSLSELGHVAEVAGTDLATLESSISKLQKAIVQGASGSKSMAEAFRELDLSAEALAQLSPEQQFLAVAGAIAKIPDPTMRAAKAMELFGRSGTQLLPLILSDIEAIRREARELGLVISDEDAAKAAEFGDALDRVRKSLGGILTQLGAALAGPLTAIAEFVTSIVSRVSRWVAENRELINTIAFIASVVAASGAAIFTLGVAIIGVGAVFSAAGAIMSAAIGAVTIAVSALVGVFTFLLTPIGLVAGAVIGLGGYLIYAALESTKSLLGLADMFDSLGIIATEAWGGIVAAVMRGELQLAGRIAFLALEVGYLTLANRMKTVWADVTMFFKQVWANAVIGIVNLGADIYFGIAKYFDQLGAALIDGFAVAEVYIIGALDKITTEISKALVKLQEFFGLISSEESLKIQAQLDDELARRASGRERELGQGVGERAAELASRDTQRQATREDFSRTVSQILTPTAPPIDEAELRAAEARLAAAQGELDSAVAFAKRPQRKRGFAQIQQPMEMAAKEVTKTNAIGTSSAAAVYAGVFGSSGGNPNRKLEENTSRTNALLQKIAMKPSNGFTP